MAKKILWGDRAVVSINSVFYFIIRDEAYDDRWLLQTLKQEAIKSFTTKSLDDVIQYGKYILFSPGFVEQVEEAPKEVPLPAVEVKPLDPLLVTYLTDQKQTALITSPTGNCQMATIAYYDHLSDDLAERKSQLKALFKEANYPLVLLDVTKGKIQSVKDTFPKGSLIVQQEYVNPNGTKMCLFIGRTAAIK